MKNLRAAYQEMYLVTKNVYSKVLDCIDERSKANVEELNRQLEEEEERRPAEEYFDDIAGQDIVQGVEEQSVPIQAREEQYAQPSAPLPPLPPVPPLPPLPPRQYHPRLTYQPSLPPIENILREPEQVRPIPRLTKSTHPQLFYQPTKRQMELQSEIIGPQSSTKPRKKTFIERMPPIAAEVEPPSRVLPPPASAEWGLRTTRPPRYFGNLMKQPARASPSLKLPLPARDRPRPAVSYQDEGLEEIVDYTPPPRPAVSRGIPRTAVSYQDEGLEEIVDYTPPPRPAVSRGELMPETPCVRGKNKYLCSKPYSRPAKTQFQCEICQKFLTSRYNLNRHIASIHRTTSTTEQVGPQQVEPQPGFSGWSAEMETGSLPSHRKRAVEEEGDPEDAPLSKVLVYRRKKKDPPSGSGLNKSFENWQ
jgi:hypothetical protein